MVTDMGTVHLFLSHLFQKLNSKLVSSHPQLNRMGKKIGYPSYIEDKELLEKDFQGVCSMSITPATQLFFLLWWRPPIM